MLFGTLPTSVIVPVALMSFTSPATNPSPVTVTSGAVSAVPLYSLDTVFEVSVTFRFVTVSVPFTVFTVN